MSSPPLQRSNGYERLFRVQWVFWLLGMISLASVSSYSIHADWEHTEEEERTKLQTLANIIDVNLSKQLENTDRALLTLRDHLSDLPDSSRYSAPQAEHLNHMLQSLLGIRTMLVLDKHGTVRLSSRRDLIGLNFRERAYFQRAADDPHGPARLFVSAPFQTVLNTWALNLTRVIRNTDGTFSGIVVAALDPDYFATLLNSARLAEDYRAVLIHGEGLVFQAAPNDAVVVGQNVRRPGSLVGVHLETGRKHSFFTGLTPVSGERRLMTIVTVLPPHLPMDVPLVLNISRDYGAAMSVWRRAAYRQGAIVVSIALASMLLLFGFQRRLKSQYAELEKADLEIQRQHAQLLNAQHIAHLGSWEVDARSEKLTCSQETARIFEIDIGSRPLSRADLFDAVHPDDTLLASGADQEPLNAADTREATYRLLMRDGRVKWVSERSKVEFDERGRLVRTVGTVQDITESKLARDSLLASEAKLRMLLDHAADAVFIAARDGYWTYVNAEAERLVGYSAAELIGRTVFDLVPEPHRELHRKNFAQLTDGVPVRGELRLVHKDGHRVPVEVNAVLLPDGAIYGACRDVSERIQAEQKLRVAAAAFETEEGIIITDSKGTILQTNKAFTLISGYSADEAIGKTPAILSSGRQDADFYRRLWGTLAKERSWRGEIWNKRKNGEIFPEWLTITGVPDAFGRVSHYVAVFSDITERKAKEEQIRRLAFYDALTGLPNRRLLHDRFEQALRKSARQADHGAVLFMDLDRFKQLNDTHGHEAGDELLKEVGLRAQSCVRENDTVARMGGDEFVVLLEGLSAEAEAARQQAQRVAEKIRLALDRPYEIQGEIHHSSPSIGVCMFSGKSTSVAELLRRADLSMYEAKSVGRNTVRFYEEKIGE